MQQVNAILMGVDILLSKEEIPLRDRKMICRIQNAANELYMANATEEEIQQLKEKERVKLEKNQDNQVKMLELADQLTIYKSYVSDAQKISESLEERFRNDLELFRVNVHGIKSMSRQLGYLQMGEAGEIMEMAAKANHLSFIEKNLNGFLADLRIAIEEAKREIAHLETELSTQTDAIGKRDDNFSENELEEKLENLKSAFLQFDMDQIEQLMLELRQIKWEPSKGLLFEKLGTCVEELEYEQGIYLIEKMES